MFTRDEMERAFLHYQQVAAEAARSSDWRAWADLFTEDATYFEHHFGEMHGREEIYNWISETMQTAPNNEMTSFPIDWYVIDEAKGWVICQVLNRMRDVGDGSVHQAANWTLLKYAGHDQWSYEEDMYNPNEFATMITGWLQAREARA
jgi:ketosteroid isomerase-like protein